MVYSPKLDMLGYTNMLLVPVGECVKMVKVSLACFCQWWHNISGITIDNLSKETIFYYLEEGSSLTNILNYCILLGKYFIYTNKL